MKDPVIVQFQFTVVAEVDRAALMALPGEPGRNFGGEDAEPPVDGIAIAVSLIEHAAADAVVGMLPEQLDAFVTDVQSKVLAVRTPEIGGVW